VAGAEGTAGGGQHHHAHAVVAGDGRQLGAQRGQHGLGQRIEGLWPVERQRDDAARIPAAQQKGSSVVSMVSPRKRGTPCVPRSA
jgi:hypothetical protein